MKSNYDYLFFCKVSSWKLKLPQNQTNQFFERHFQMMIRITEKILSTSSSTGLHRKYSSLATARSAPGNYPYFWSSVVATMLSSGKCNKLSSVKLSVDEYEK